MIKYLTVSAVLAFLAWGNASPVAHTLESRADVIAAATR